MALRMARVNVNDLMRYSPSGKTFDPAWLRSHPTYDGRDETIEVTKGHADMIALNKAQAEFGRTLREVLVPAVKRMNDSVVRASAALNRLLAR